jgi:hypothetical protein
LTQTLATANIPDASATYTHEWSSTGIAKPWNMFDVEITNLYGRATTRPRIITENKSVVISIIPTTLEAPLDLINHSLSLSLLLAIKDSTTPTLLMANKLD